jgi:hypothetical protein
MTDARAFERRAAGRAERARLRNRYQSTERGERPEMAGPECAGLAAAAWVVSGEVRWAVQPSANHPCFSVLLKVAIVRMPHNPRNIPISNREPNRDGKIKRMFGMRETKVRMSKAADIMLAKARDCLTLAREESLSAIQLHDSASKQRIDADRLNDGAKKLARLGHALEADALNLRAGSDILVA